MKAKTLKKKIRRLETRLREGPKKLDKLKRKLAALVTASDSDGKKKLVARAAVARTAPKRKTTAPTKEPRPKATPAVKPAIAKQPRVRKKAKRKLNLSPERRAQLADAMRARWAAKRAMQNPSRDFTLGSTPQES